MRLKRRKCVFLRHHFLRMKFRKVLVSVLSSVFAGAAIGVYYYTYDFAFMIIPVIISGLVMSLHPYLMLRKEELRAATDQVLNRRRVLVTVRAALFILAVSLFAAEIYFDVYA